MSSTARLPTKEGGPLLATRAPDGALELEYQHAQGNYRSRLSPEALSRSFVTKTAPGAVEYMTSHSPSIIVVDERCATASWEIKVVGGAPVTAVVNLRRQEPKAST